MNCYNIDFLGPNDIVLTTISIQASLLTSGFEIKINIKILKLEFK